MCLGIDHLEYWAGTSQATQADPEMESSSDRCPILTNVSWNWPSGVLSGPFPSYSCNSKRVLAEREIFENNQRGDPLNLTTYFIEIIEIHQENEANLHFLEIPIWNVEIMKILKWSKGGPFDFESFFHWNHWNSLGKWSKLAFSGKSKFRSLINFHGSLQKPKKTKIPFKYVHYWIVKPKKTKIPFEYVHSCQNTWYSIGKWMILRRRVASYISKLQFP